MLFFPRGFFFPDGFIESSGIGFHWVEAMTKVDECFGWPDLGISTPGSRSVVVVMGMERGGETGVSAISRL